MYSWNEEQIAHLLKEEMDVGETMSALLSHLGQFDIESEASKKIDARATMQLSVRRGLHGAVPGF